jgi:methionyl-tRNA formyltransferase
VARIAVAATAPFGADVLEGLAGRHEVVELLTRPDRPRGRGRKPGAPPAKERAQRLGIPVRQEERLSAETPLAADTVVVAAYGLLIPSGLLDRALWLNVHPSLLPRWRGAAPIERALMAGDQETGVTIIRLEPQLDAGPVAAQEAFPLSPEDDFGTVSARAAELGAALLEEVLREPSFTPQPAEGATYAEKIGPEDRLLRPESAGAVEVDRVVRALHPHIGARLGDLRVRRARPAGDDDVAPGELAARDGRLVLGCSPGALELLEVQPAGKRPMDAASYLRGHAVQPTGPRE